MYQPPICKNDRCSNLVPPSKNPGVKRLFCSARCARRYHSRLTYSRERGTSGEGMTFVNEQGQAQVKRTMALTSKVAQLRWKNHLNACSLHGGYCPGRNDVYGRKKLCIIAAVLSDDETQLYEAEHGRPVKRNATTVDGRWLDDLSAAERAGMDARAATPFYISDEERQKMFDAGAGRREEYSYPDEATREANEGLPPVSPSS